MSAEWSESSKQGARVARDYTQFKGAVGTVLYTDSFCSITFCAVNVVTHFT